MREQHAYFSARPWFALGFILINSSLHVICSSFWPSVALSNGEDKSVEPELLLLSSHL